MKQTRGGDRNGAASLDERRPEVKPAAVDVCVNLSDFVVVVVVVSHDGVVEAPPDADANNIDSKASASKRSQGKGTTQKIQSWFKMKVLF